MEVNFNLMGTAMGFNVKLLKHINAGDAERIKDYLCAAFDGKDPLNFDTHPCSDMIRAGIDLIKSKGWKVYVGKWKTIGDQLIVVSPEGKYYHSKFEH